MIFSATTALYVGSTSYSKAYIGDTLVWPSTPPPPPISDYLTFEIISGGTLQLSGNCVSAQTVEYRVNGGSWNIMQVYGATAADAINVNAGDIVEWKGTNVRYARGETLTATTFISNTLFNVSGNLLSLIYGDYASSQTTLHTSMSQLFMGSGVVSAKNLVFPLYMDIYGSSDDIIHYWGMFSNCTSLVDAPVLPATELSFRCYYLMFANCTSLTAAPVLPATALTEGCYVGMFSKCTSLATAPELPATVLADYCYQSMFNFCTFTNPPALPATTLADYCYNDMFANCTSLTAAPVLPATALTEGCYAGMFNYCTSLTTAPALPATALAEWCYSDMFFYCTSLTVAPVLSAPMLVANCYDDMFANCNNLNYIKCLATNPDISYTANWTYSLPSSGTFVKKAGVNTWSRGFNGIPNGWTVIEE